MFQKQTEETKKKETKKGRYELFKTFITFYYVHGVGYRGRPQK